ncbi:MAG: radical SAM family heme chaperone HemW [Bacteroidaceae bacterium]|nr:radical SAM family heme chaperone HemW [Bacteroidaceae bacterium]
MSGIYIHIPFCKTRCIYCDFFSTTQLEQRELYVDAICKEIGMTDKYLDGDTIHSIYFGGGTPSQLDTKQIGRIFDTIQAHHPIAPDCEITIELNPDDVTKAYADRLRQLPVNRVSLGIQSFHDDILRFIHRRHTSQQAIDAVRLLQENGFRNISIDLMFGFPDETLEAWQYDIEQALQMNVQHISAYSLMYEEGTKLYNLLTLHQIQEIDEELSRTMYQTLMERLKDAGFDHYEISNFALPDYYSRHNSSYWNNTHYLGLGAGAHSYNGTSRQSNVCNLKKYIDGIQHGEPCVDNETLTKDQQYNETVMTRLRTCKGLNTDDIKTNFGYDYYLHLMTAATPYLNIGLLKNTQGNLSLTPKGIFISNDIISSLFV